MTTEQSTPKRLRWWEREGRHIKYLCNNRRRLLIIWLFVFFFGVWVLNLFVPYDSETQSLLAWIVDLGGRSLSFATFLVGAGIYYAETREEDITRWGHKLTVEFTFGMNESGEPIPRLRCNRAYLAGESDIRAWAQQVGSQMTGERFLNFGPFIEERFVDYEVDTDDLAYRHHFVRFYLRNLPDLLTHDAAKYAEEFEMAKEAEEAGCISKQDKEKLSPRNKQCFELRRTFLQQQNEGDFNDMSFDDALDRGLALEWKIGKNHLEERSLWFAGKLPQFEAN